MAGVVPFAGVGRGAADDELRLVLEGELLHLVVVDAAGLGVEAVGDGVVEEAGGVDRGTVGEVAALAEVKTHEGVAGVEDSHRDGHVGLGAGVRLHVGPFGSVELLQAVDGQLLDLVHDLATAVVALAGITLCILVGADGSHGREDLVRNVIFRSDEFEAGLLALVFLFDQIEDFDVLFHTS